MAAAVLVWHKCHEEEQGDFGEPCAGGWGFPLLFQPAKPGHVLLHVALDFAAFSEQEERFIGNQMKIHTYHSVTFVSLHI